MDNFNNVKVLVVDDTPATIGILSESLESEGFQVFIATSGDKALQRAGAIKPDIILLDVMMPGIDGFETCKRLKSIPSIKDVPILFMTGLNAIESKVKGFQAGAVDYVTKPIEIDEMLSRIKTHVALRNTNRLLEEKNSQLELEIKERKSAEERVKELNANLERKVEDRTKELADVNRMLKMLSECNQALVRATHKDELLITTCRIIIEFGGYQFVQVGFFNDDSYNDVFLAVELGKSESSVNRNIMLSEKEQKQFMDKAFVENNIIIKEIDDTIDRDQNSLISKHSTLKSSITLPLSISKKLVGFLKIFSDKENSFRNDEIVLLKELAGDLAFGIKLLKEREELEKTEKALRENKILFDQVSAQSQVVVWAVDDRGVFSFISNASQQVWGYLPEELVGKKSYSDLFFEEDHEYIKAFGVRLKSAGKSLHDNIYRNIKKDGGIIWVSISGFPIYNDDGSFVGYRGSLVNVTERKRMIDEIITAKKIAEEANRLKDSLLSNISHEFRTPLNGILGFAQLLEDELADLSSLDMARKISRSGKRLMNTLDTVLMLVQLNNKDFVANRSETDVVYILKQVYNSYQTFAEEKNLDFELKHEVEFVVCSIDESLLKKLVSYIVDNAIKYTNSGKVKISLKKTKEAEKFSLIIDVEDTGIGISSDAASVIFEEFRQASEGYKRAFEGVGLGLSNARKIAKLLGAEITVDSQVNVGSRFSISLPILDSEKKLSPRVSSIQPPSQKSVYIQNNYQILLIEDNPLNIEVILNFLKRKGTITYSQNGREAVEIAAKNNFDLFLIDINLGNDFDGMDVLNELKKIEKYKTTPSIAITGYASEESKQEFLSKGFSRYLAKPFDKKELLTVVDEIMLAKH